MKQSFFARLFKDFRFWIVCGLVILAVVAIVIVMFLRKSAVGLIAIDEIDGKISPNSPFELKINEKNLSTQEIRELIKTEPEFDYSIIENGSGTFTITPIDFFDANTTVKFTIKDKDFKFDVDNKLVLLSNFPVDGSNDVPISSGIEFKLNSKGITSKDFESAFSISPDVDGRYSYENGRFVFYPENGFDYGTKYNVSLDSSFATLDGASLGESVDLSFTTITELDERFDSMFMLSGNGCSINSLSSEVPIVRAYIDDYIDIDNQDISVTIYSYNGYEDYSSAIKKTVLENVDNYNPKVSVDLGGLKKYASFDVTPIKASTEYASQYGNCIIQFPQTLPEGWYLAELGLTVDGSYLYRQILVQISDLSVFYMTSGSDILTWINDAATGKPVKDAKVVFDGTVKAEGTTEDDGYVRMQTGISEVDRYSKNESYITVTSGNKAFVTGESYYMGYAEGYGNGSGEYMAYLFTDREIYHTTDKIQIWGMAKPRYDGVNPPKNLRVVLDDDAVGEDVELLPDGTFTVTMEIEDFSAKYWATLELVADDAVVYRKTIQIQDFVKPVYTASAKTDKPVYMADEDGASVDLELTVSTFDGTPVSNFDVELSTNSDNIRLNNTAFTTDSSGRLNTNLQIVGSDDTWVPQIYYYNFTSTDAQSENFYIYDTVNVIYRDVMLDAEPNFEGENAKIEVNTNRIDISKIETPKQIWEKDALKGEPLSMSVDAYIYRVYYEKIKVGEHYDFINRVTVPEYDYEKHEELFDSKHFETVDGKYTLDGLPTSNNDSCYYVKLNTEDSKGRNVETKIYLGDLSSPYGSYRDGIDNYSLLKNVDMSKAASKNEAFFYDMTSTFEDDENITYNLLKNGQPIEKMEGRILYSIVQSEFSDINVVDDDKISIPFDEKLLPNYVITGAYFDGKHIFELQNTYMQFDPKQRELDVEILPEQSEYKPGDDAQVDIKVTDAKTGEPSGDTSVVVSIVDEAVFSISDQYVDLLGSMYRGVYYPNIKKYASYMQRNSDNAAEKGGGGGEDMRKSFEDTAYFATATTDQSGNAKFSYTLPDNITSWRITSLAASKENMAGNSKTNIVTTKDFFILLIVNPTLIEGDSFTVGAYGAGSKVGEDDIVTYNVSIAGDNGTGDSLSVTSGLRNYAEIEFGTLTAGEYTVTIEAECGSYSDSMELPFKVVESGIDVSLMETFGLKDEVTVDSKYYPITISFYDERAKIYNTVFSSVQNISDGGRVDMRLARRYIAQEMKKQGIDWYDASALDDDYSDITGNQVLSLLPYTDGDMELTVKAYLALPKFMDLSRLDVINEEGIEIYEGSRSSMYLAQAISGKGIDVNLNDMLERNSDLPYVDKVYIALAMAISGDTENAQKWYDSLVKENLSELTGISGEKALFVEINDGDRSDSDCTAAASMLATALNTEDADGLVRYLAEKKSKYEPYIFEQIYYLQNITSDEKITSSFSYTRDGETVDVELDNKFTSISFTKKQLEEADFKVKSGEILADVYYTGTPADVSEEKNKLIGFTKTIEPVGGSFEPGSLVKITLTPDLSTFDSDIGNSMMVIDDYIPTGMRFDKYDRSYTNDDATARGWYMNSRQGQKLQFTVYGLDYAKIKPIVYYVRCATSGEYVVESAYITSSDGETWGLSERDTVVIR